MSGNLDTFWVFADALTAEDTQQRDLALLCLWALYADRYQNTSKRRFYSSVGKRALRKLSRTVWDQLGESGFLQRERVGVRLKVLDIVDGVAWDLEGAQLDTARALFWELTRQVHKRQRRSGPWHYRLGRDREAGLSKDAVRAMVAGKQWWE